MVFKADHAQALRVRAKIKLRFWVLRHLHGKAPKRRSTVIFLRFDNIARQDASAHKNVKLFLRELLALILQKSESKKMEKNRTDLGIPFSFVPEIVA
jgi:hypothetical protein